MEFGKEMLKHFYLDNNYLQLNHGNWGATPIEILNFRINQIKEQEYLPQDFFRKKVYELQIENCKQIAEFFGTSPENICLIDNTAHGINSCLISVPLSAGDFILIQSFTSDATKNAAQRISQLRNFNIATLQIDITKNNVITEDYIVQLYERMLDENTNIKLIILDHISNSVPILWPIEQICKLCKSRNVLTLIDCGHSLGQILDIKLDNFLPDYFLGNLHKWNFVPNSCGLLYIAKQHQKTFCNIIAGHNFMNVDYRKQFQVYGTRDLSSLFCWKESRNFVEKCGGQNIIHNYNTSLAISAAIMLSKMWKTCIFPLEVNLIAPFMAIVKLPILKDYPIPTNTSQIIQNYTSLSNDLLLKYKIVVSTYAICNELWLRFSCQIYNEISDYENLANVILELAK